MEQSQLMKKVQWKDLTKLSRKEILIENTITLPWLIASWILAYNKLYLLAAPCSVMFFLTALRQVHNGFHNSLGTSKKLTWLSLYLNSLLMMISSHAVKFNHLRHHKYYPGEEDHEGKCAKMKWYRAILHGPQHVYDIHAVTWRLGNKFYRKDLVIELISIALFTTVAFWIGSGFLIYHICAMVAGEFFSAFFAVWTVHHDLEMHTIARTQRKGWKNFITYDMFYHLEHHLFPAVPTIKIKELARRIDAVLPEMEKRTTF
jgi:fatty acid desaturase